MFLAVLPSNDNRMILSQKISACEAKRSPLVKVDWTHMQDLHVTLGYIQNVDDTDVRAVTLGMVAVSQTSPFMCNVEEIRVYGNAVVLRLEPYQQLLTIHKKMNQKLMEVSEGRYQFSVKGRFDPHLTVGRIRNLRALNPLHKHQFMSLIEEQFRSTSFLIQQAALLRRMPESATPAYQNIQLYTLR
jgi:2'-5' RNA ligase